MNLTPMADLMVSPGTLVSLVAVAILVMTNVRAGRHPAALPAWEHAFGIVGLAAVVNGQYLGLVDAPAERMMGEVGRILYVHVPSAWLTMLWFFFAFLAAIACLMVRNTDRRLAIDSFVEASSEVGVALALLLLATGSIFAHPTWGTWWTWDPRLTSSAVMTLAFVGVLTLRSMVDDVERRMTLGSVVTILAGLSMFVTYFSVRWWRTMHQMQSSPETIDPGMVLILRINAFALLFLSTWFVARRWRIAHANSLAAMPESLPPNPNGAPA